MVAGTGNAGFIKMELVVGRGVEQALENGPCVSDKGRLRFRGLIVTVERRLL